MTGNVLQITPRDRHPRTWSVFTVMKKNKIETRTEKPQIERTKAQMEDYVFRKMMLWCLGAVVAEVIMILFNRFYVHARTDEIGAMAALDKVLMVLPFVGVIGFLVFLVLGLRIWRNDDPVHEGTAQFILCAAFLAVGVGCFVMRHYGTVGAPVVLAAIPCLGVLALLYYLFQKECFCCAIICFLTILGLWIYRVTSGGPTAHVCMCVTAVLGIVGVQLGRKLQKSDGVLVRGERRTRLFQPDAVYPAFYLTVIFAALVMIAAIVFGVAVAYYAIWVVVAWLFILAVFFTSKLI